MNLSKMSIGGGGRGVGSSSRLTARRPLRLQTTIRPLLPIPGRTSISPASRNRRSLAAVTALPVPAHFATTSLGTTPKRATNPSTSRSLWLIRSVLFPPGISASQDDPETRFDTPAATSPLPRLARRRSRPHAPHMVGVCGRLRPKGSNPLGRRSGCGRWFWGVVWGTVCSRPPPSADGSQTDGSRNAISGSTPTSLCRASAEPS